jgi:hypothetical protein
MSEPHLPGTLPGQDDPVYQTWVMLLNGYGYNWYKLDNQLRADDLLIRSRASEHLAAAVSRLRDVEARYRRKYLPPPTREHPDADPDHLAAARQIRAIAERILDIDTRLRGAAVPPNDAVWMRHRDELDSLWQLSECDVVLVGAAKDLAAAVAELPPDMAVDAVVEARIDQQLGYLSAALAQRGDLLAILR